MTEPMTREQRHAAKKALTDAMLDASSGYHHDTVIHASMTILLTAVITQSNSPATARKMLDMIAEMLGEMLSQFDHDLRHGLVEKDDVTAH